MQDQTTEAPVACTLLDKDLAERLKVLERDIVGRSANQRLLADGVELTFAATDKIRRSIFTLIEQETACCSFLTIEVTFEPAHGPIRLAITGPEVARSFIQETFARR